MKRIILIAVSLLSTTFAVSANTGYLYTNNEGCRVSIIKWGGLYNILASQNINGEVEKASVYLSEDLDPSKTEIGAYCGDYGIDISNENGETMVSCLNGRASVKMDLTSDMNISKFEFKGYHYYIFKKVIDDFSCSNLKLESTWHE